MSRHRAIVDVEIERETGRRECRVCGRKIIGYGSEARHDGEAVTIIVPHKDDAAVFAEAVHTGQVRLDSIPAEATNEERARAVVEAVYAAGLLRKRAGKAPEDIEIVAPHPEPDWAAEAYH